MTAHHFSVGTRASLVECPADALETIATCNDLEVIEAAITVNPVTGAVAVFVATKPPTSDAVARERAAWTVPEQRSAS